MLKPNKPTIAETVQYIRSLGFTCSYRSATRELTFTSWHDGKKVVNLFDIREHYRVYTDLIDAMLAARYIAFGPITF